ncbi:hypothetical protein [Pantoea agglomerans]|uniref:hypothetical protein n=1 Tax=Enterobacter agglomerans TaxID=549 RepID=UPI001F14A96E|nr:hypothetical protein [Pantoea agglomerans]
MTQYYFQGMLGLGDSIYQRPFLRHFPGAYVRTCWPELYRGLDIKCVRSGTHLRTQEKNELRTRYAYHPAPRGGVIKRIGYGPNDLANGGIIPAFRHQFVVDGPLLFDLPQFNDLHPRIPVDRPVAIIRPATVRIEWASASRNPDPDYLVRAAQMLRQHFFMVSVADTVPGVEWIVGNEPEADLKLHHGEMTLTQLCSLYAHAACVVSPVGFSIPMAIAYGRPLFVVAGGRGGHNAPEILTCSEMDLRRVRWAIPDNYCRCNQANHDCDRRISNFDEKFNEWLHEIVL